MPLYFVNEHLIQEENRGEGTWDKSKELYKRFMIKTAAGAVKRMPDGSFEPLDRVICTHNCSLDPMAKTRISSVVKAGEEDRPPKVSVKTSVDTRYDTDAFVVALPYTGMVLPIDKIDASALAIFKTMILRSDKMTLEHEDGKYMRCLYLVLRPHHEHLGGEWYKDECNLVVSFVHSNKSKNDEPNENTKWFVQTVTVRFGTNGKYEISTSHEEMPYDSINIDDLRNVPLCQTVEPVVFTPREDGAPSNPPRVAKSEAKDYGDNEYRGNSGGKKGKRGKSARNRRGRD